METIIVLSSDEDELGGKSTVQLIRISKRLRTRTVQDYESTTTVELKLIRLQDND